mmetsp:Transcript_51269/g.137091  ORF Transcript_51269/g.137091 Transcript_51269/m.137091 type:complete len:212 (-) Transcript_51269:288-923(-)
MLPETRRVRILRPVRTCRWRRAGCSVATLARHPSVPSAAPLCPALCPLRTLPRTASAYTCTAGRPRRVHRTGPDFGYQPGCSSKTGTACHRPTASRPPWDTRRARSSCSAAGTSPSSCHRRSRQFAQAGHGDPSNAIAGPQRSQRGAPCQRHPKRGRIRWTALPPEAPAGRPPCGSPSPCGCAASPTWHPCSASCAWPGAWPPRRWSAPLA